MSRPRPRSVPASAARCTRQIAFSLAVAAPFVLGFAPGVSDLGARATSYCIEPVEDGRPTEADLGATWRMVSRVEKIPRLDQLFIQPLNRDGRWTVDREGRYRPFEGVFPRGIGLKWIVDGSGRVIGANLSDLFVIEQHVDRFRHLLTLKEQGAGTLWGLAYDPYSGTVFVSTSSDLYELIGDRLVHSRFSAEAAVQGFAPLHVPKFLASSQAYLLETQSGTFVIRDRNGQWREIYRLACTRCRNYETEVTEIEREGLAVVKTAMEIFALDLRDTQNPKAFKVFGKQGNLARNRAQFSRETGTFLIYDNEVFLGLSQDSSVPSVTPEDSWLLRVTPEGVHPVPGERVVPAASTETSTTFYFPKLLDLPGRGEVLIFTADGLALYDGKLVRRIPNSGPDRLGSLPAAAALQAIDKVVIIGDTGLHELTRDGEVVRLAPPFLDSGFPPPVLADAPSMGLAIALTGDGVFALDRHGSFQRVPGGEHVELDLLSRAIASLPGSGDVLLQASDGLYLFRNAPCSH